MNVFIVKKTTLRNTPTHQPGGPNRHVPAWGAWVLLLPTFLLTRWLINTLFPHSDEWFAWSTLAFLWISEPEDTGPQGWLCFPSKLFLREMGSSTSILAALERTWALLWGPISAG